jgi:uncharacterized protein (TIGR03435 family)
MIGQLTNHLWQSTVFALAAAVLTLAFRANRAKVRYSIWWIASVKFLVPFSMLIGLGSQIQWTPTAKQIAARAPSPVVLTIEQFSEPFLSDPAGPRATQSPARLILPAVAAAWFCGFAAIAFLRWRAWRGIRNTLHRSIPLNLPLPVEARISSGLLEPGIVGLWRPVLLLPEGILERLAPSEFEAVLAHELCHVRRRDNLLASIHMLVEAFFWFHPLIWWIGARLVDERERACDEHVVSLGNRPDVYADAILNVCKLYAESPLSCVSGVTGAGIRRRIEAILSGRRIAGLNLAKKTLLACAAMVAVLAPVSTGVLIGVGHVKAQERAATAPKFDAVSIRPCAPGVAGKGRGGAGTGGTEPANGLSGYFSRSPGRFNASCATLMAMVNVAYVDFGGETLLNDARSPMQAPKRIKGIPNWAMSARYTIEAVTDDPVANGPTEGMSSPAWRRMAGPTFRALLEDRFQLKVHRDLEEVPMYSLTVAKGGLKIKPATGADCTEPEHAPNGGFIMRPLKPGDKPYCHWMGGVPQGPNRTVLGGGVPLSRLAEFLSSFVLDRHVIDQTGVTGDFNIHLEYLPDERTPCNGPPALCQVDPTSDLPEAPSIFAAIEHQLGLKLEPTKGQHGYLMVDQVERPSEN